MKPRQFQVGDLVLLNANVAQPNRPGGKFGVGPVAKVFGRGVYALLDPEDREMNKTWNAMNLRPFSQ